MNAVADVVPLQAPSPRTVLADARGTDRALRVAWHTDGDNGVVVLSIWREDHCTATFRLAAAEVPLLVDTLVRGLAPPALEPPAAHDASPTAAVTRILPRLPGGAPAT